MKTRVIYKKYNFRVVQKEAAWNRPHMFAYHIERKRLWWAAKAIVYDRQEAIDYANELAKTI